MGKKSRAKREKREKREEQGTEPRYKNFGAEILTGQKTALESICLFIIHWAVYLMLLTPLLVSAKYFFPYVGPKGLYLMGLIEIAFFTWLVLAIHSPKYRPKRSVLLLSLTAFLTVLILASIFGADPSRSFWSKFERMSGLLMWLHLFGLFLVLSTTFRNRRAWMRVFAISVGIAVFVSFLFFMDKAGMEKLPVARNGSTLGNSSFLATYLLFNLCFAVYIFWTVKRKKEFKLWSFTRAKYPCLFLSTAAILTMAVVLIMSKGAAATLAFFGALGLMAVFWLAFEIKNKGLRLFGKIILVLSAVIFLAGITLLYVPDSIVQQKLIEMRNRARPLLWQMGWKGFLEKPILGWGPQNFAFVFNDNFEPCFYISECGGETRFDQAHNIVIDNLVDAGILGLLGYISVLIFSCYVFWKNYFRKRIEFWAPAVFTSFLIAHFVQNLMVFDMPASFLMLFIALGFSGAVAQSFEQPEKVQQKRTVGKPLIILLIAAVFLFSFSNFVYKPAKVGSGLIEVMTARTMEQKKAAYEQALSFSPIGRYQARTHLAGELVKNSQQQGRYFMEEFELIIEELKKSIESSPLDYFSHLLLGKVYNAYAGIAGGENFERAEQVLERALELSPTKQDGYWELARTKILLGKNEEGIALVEKAVELEPRVPFSHIYLVNLANIIGDTDLAIQKAKEAIEILPSLEPDLKNILGEENL